MKANHGLLKYNKTILRSWNRTANLKRYPHPQLVLGPTSRTTRLPHNPLESFDPGSDLCSRCWCLPPSTTLLHDPLESLLHLDARSLIRALWGIPTTINNAVTFLWIKRYQAIDIQVDAPRSFRIYWWMRGAVYNAIIVFCLFCLVPLTNVMLSAERPFL